MSKILEAESFLYNANSRFIEEMYQKYISDPASVDNSWQDFFKNYQADRAASEKLLKGASWSPNKTQILGVVTEKVAPKAAKEKKAEASGVDNNLLIEKMLQAFRERGHLLANLDPLGIDIPLSAASQRLAPEDFGVDLAVSSEIKNAYDRLKTIYSGTVACEFEHMSSQEEKDWLYQNTENLAALKQGLTIDEKREILKDLVEAESFESFLHSRFPGAKRFSIEGGEAAVVFMLQVIKVAAKAGCLESILGMAHRGRLNILTKIYGKSYASLFGEFMGNLKRDPKSSLISGDVKYHAGKSVDAEFDGHKINLTMLPNPSHLEAVNPVLQGKVRARQDLLGDAERSKVQGILIHGDAAMAGQGVVAESLSFVNIAGFRSGGTMHLVINNQVGFTARPDKSRSGRYATDIAKSIGAPIIHVNSQDAEAVLLVARIAELYRQKFAKDIVVDLVCYRKYGHNEGDEPMFTQPIMYSIIKERKNPHQLYFEKLKADTISEAQYQKMISDFVQKLDDQYNKAALPSFYENHLPGGDWQGIELSDQAEAVEEQTGIAADILQKIGKALYSCPEGFNLNSKVERLLKAKKEMFDSGKKLDWATAEALAFGSLLLEGIKVRLSGQDSGRGTFSHRHSVLVDQKTEATYLPLNNIAPGQEKFEVVDSNLSEYGVLGFEYGYSLASPKILSLWEGQFGDFANGAQIMIDQFISSAEQKWLQVSGLVMLLPHGFEGQGPEHSSARLERYLQLCAENNMQVVNCTTPANYFHALRRQICRNFRTPLIVMTPKSMLRTLESDLAEFEKNTKFKPVIAESENLDAKAVKRVVICSGKIYYDLIAERSRQNIQNVALVRLEQYYPFPANYLADAVREYKNAEFIWCQEEPQNMGGWNFVCHYLAQTLKELGFGNKLPQYIGRKASASPATGYAKVHEEEQRDIAQKALIL